MRYTRLRLTPRGIVLAAEHRRRLGADEGAARAALMAFARRARPGCWVVWLSEDPLALRAEPRPGSRVRDGMAVRFAPSPVADRPGPLAKPWPPCAYDALRARDAITLLTSSDGHEIWEACSGAVVGWDGQSIVCVPADRPRVISTSEAALRARVAVREAPLLTADRMPLLLLNAIKGSCALALADRPPFPWSVRRRIDAALRRSTGWP
ncbi:MAG: hypothetical protein IPG96_18070 [Proteobacteria bacterium]|nr:hypothetical protein [Pseudomonadota bacterium]